MIQRGWLVAMALAAPALPQAVARGVPHPIHVTSTQIEQPANGRPLEVTMRIFTDDLETALAQNGYPVSVSADVDSTVHVALEQYLATRFRMRADGGSLALRVVRHVREGEATLLYIRAEVPRRFESLTVSHEVLLELHADQTNLVHVAVGGARRSAMMRRGASIGVFEDLGGASWGRSH